jgi:hypothetical protein
VIDDGHVVGRIRHAAERTNDVWMWHVTVLIPSPPYGSARTLDAAKAAFQEAWTAFKAAAGPKRLAQAFETQDNANSKGRNKKPSLGLASDGS